MSKIDTIEAVSRNISRSTIHVLPRRCTYIRNWNSRCKACLNACKHDAIKRSIGRLSLDMEVCTDCGACVAACPTSAFLTTAPEAAQIVSAAKTGAERVGGTACFACSKLAAEVRIDESKVCVLPCLDYLDEYLICGLFALGIERVALMRATCAECSIDGSPTAIDTIVDEVRTLLTCWDSSARLIDTTNVPDALIGKSAAPLIRSDRRTTLREGIGEGMGAVATAFEKKLAEVAGESTTETDESIIMLPEERYPASTYRSLRVLNALKHLGDPKPDTLIKSRLWARPQIDPKRCMHCGMCAKMCPTQALEYEGSFDEDGRHIAGSHATLRFRPQLCSGCGLCKNSCTTRSLNLPHIIKAGELLSDEAITLFEDEVANETIV